MNFSILYLELPFNHPSHYNSAKLPTLPPICIWRTGNIDQAQHELRATVVWQTIMTILAYYGRVGVPFSHLPAIE